jgi:hypothetical protein
MKNLKFYYLVTLTLVRCPIIYLAFPGAVGPLETLATGARPGVLLQTESAVTAGRQLFITRGFSGGISGGLPGFGRGHVELPEVKKYEKTTLYTLKTKLCSNYQTKSI